MPTLGQIHRALLARWRRTMNLVGPGDLAFHFADCARALAGLEPEGRWVDLGSGAGFPGLVLADRWPALRVDLVDSRQKRCVFLEQVLATAEIPPNRVRVLRQRVEGLDPDPPYDGLVARAFAPPAAVLDHARRLVRPGGQVVLFLQGDAALPACPGAEVIHVEPYTVQGKARKGVRLILHSSGEG